MRIKDVVGSVLCVALAATSAEARPAAEPPAGAEPTPAGAAQPGAADGAEADPPPAAPPASPADPPAAAPPAEPPREPPSSEVAAGPEAPPAEDPASDVAAAESQAEPEAEGLPPIPLPPPKLFPAEPAAEQSEAPLVGVQGNRFYLRTDDDWLRIYPGGRLRVDTFATLGPGMDELSPAAGAAALDMQIVLRRVRFELSGELFQRLAFTMGFELGGQRLGVDDLGSPTARFAPALATSGDLLPAEMSLSYRVRPWLNATVGQFNVPFSMANRTREYATPLLERNLAIRGFAVPHNKDLGATVWGELEDRVFAYEVGVFAGDGANRVSADARPDFAGRVFARPLASSGSCSFARLAQIGVSGRYGSRDQDAVDYDYPAIATNQGFVLWQPGYEDSYGRLNHVIPSGHQWAVGGELRLPFDLPAGRAIDLRGEAYYVSNDTREAVDGYQQTHTERFGRMKGLGWYGMVSAWLLGDAFASGEPGIHRPPTIDIDDPPATLRGLEILAFAAGINANYEGASREQSLADVATPNANIAIYQFGGGLQYWYGTFIRAGLHYAAYYTPDSGDQRRNLAVVVDNIAMDPRGNSGGEHVQHEISTRLGVTF